MDLGAWWTAVRGVPESRARLKRQREQAGHHTGRKGSRTEERTLAVSRVIGAGA